jgi:hypothetical protein
MWICSLLSEVWSGGGTSSVYGCEEPEVEVLNRAFREVSSGEESRYGLSKRTDLFRVGVAFRAAKSEAREEELGVVVEVVGVWPLNCADSSSYCLRSLGSWVWRSEILSHLSVYFSSFHSRNLGGEEGERKGTHSASPPSSSTCALKVSRPARRDSKDRVIGPSLFEARLRETARWRSSSESLMWSARRKS